MGKHRAGDRHMPGGEDQPGNSRRWRRYREVVKKLLQVTAAQAVAYLLHRWGE